MREKSASKGPFACVIGTMDLVRPLGWAGIPCVFVGHADHPARHSRYVYDFVERADPIKNPELLLRRLRDFAERQDQKPVLFYEGDGGLIFLSRNREELAPYFRFVVAEKDQIEDITDKIRFCSMAERLALPVPPSQWLAPHQVDPKDLQLRFPMIVKPVARQVRGVREFGHAKAIPIPSPDHLPKIWERLAPTQRTFLFQELISGSEASIESYHAYVDSQGKRVIDFGGKKIRTYPAAYGHSTALVTSDSSDLMTLGRDIAERVGIKGVMKMDFKRAPDGKLWLLEINPRFNLWHGLGTVGGANIPAIVYADMTGRPRPPFGPVRAGVHWRRTVSDFKSLRESGTLSPSWIWEVMSCECKTFDATDPGLVLWTLLSILRRARR